MSALRLRTKLKESKQKRMGKGELSQTRKKLKAKRKMKQAQQGPKVRELDRVDGQFEYMVFFTARRMRKAGAERQTSTVLDFLKNSCMGKNKVVYHKHPWYRMDVIDAVKLESEDDLMMLMLCHRESVRKIFKFQKQEAPEGALLF